MSKYGIAPLPEEYESKFKSNMEWLKNATQPNSSFGWISNGIVDGVDCYSGNVDGKMCFMGKLRFPYPSCLLFDFIRNDEIIKKYDDMLESSTHIKDLCKQCGITHRVYSNQWPAWGRDFVTISHWEVREDGVIEFDSFTETPEESKKMVPEVSGKVRGEILHAGYLIEPKNEDKECDVTYVVQMDLCGSIPSMIANRVLSKQPLCLARMRDCIKSCDLSNYKYGTIYNTSIEERPDFDFK